MVAVAAHCEGLLYGSGSMSALAPEDATDAFGMLFRFIGSFQKFDIEPLFGEVPISWHVGALIGSLSLGWKLPFIYRISS